MKHNKGSIILAEGLETALALKAAGILCDVRGEGLTDGPATNEPQWAGLQRSLKAMGFQVSVATLPAELTC